MNASKFKEQCLALKPLVFSSTVWQAAERLARQAFDLYQGTSLLVPKALKINRASAPADLRLQRERLFSAAC